MWLLAAFTPKLFKGPDKKQNQESRSFFPCPVMLNRVLLPGVS